MPICPRWVARPWSRRFSPSSAARANSRRRRPGRFLVERAGHRNDEVFPVSGRPSAGVPKESIWPRSPAGSYEGNVGRRTDRARRGKPYYPVLDIR